MGVGIPRGGRRSLSSGRSCEESLAWEAGRSRAADREADPERQISSGRSCEESLAWEAGTRCRGMMRVLVGASEAGTATARVLAADLAADLPEDEIGVVVGGELHDVLSGDVCVLPDPVEAREEMEGEATGARKAEAHSPMVTLSLWKSRRCSSAVSSAEPSCSSRARRSRSCSSALCWASWSAASSCSSTRAFCSAASLSDVSTLSVWVAWRMVSSTTAVASSLGAVPSEAERREGEPFFGEAPRMGERARAGEGVGERAVLGEPPGASCFISCTSVALRRSRCSIRRSASWTARAARSSSRRSSSAVDALDAALASKRLSLCTYGAVLSGAAAPSTCSAPC